MDSTLNILLTVSDDGRLVIRDNTPYDEIGADLYNHILIEKLYDHKGKEILSPPTTLIDSQEAVYYLREHDIPFKKDGKFTYKCMLIPMASHSDPVEGAYYDPETKKFYYEGDEKDFDEFWKIYHDELAINVFWFTQDIFSIYFLVSCFIAMQKAKLAEGCKGLCKESDSTLGADFLAGVVLMLEHLIANGLYEDAQEILDRLDTCGGFCKDYLKDTKGGCGCD